MTVEQLKRLIEDLPDDKPVYMCMDWTMMDNPPERSQQQWQDELNEVVNTDNRVILLNKHFR